MNKSVSISLGGLSFFIEEDAFQKLQKYLEDVKSSLKTGEEDTSEILKDVESRIAELFKEWLGNYRQVVDTKDVDKVIEVMGTPDKYRPETGQDKPADFSKSRDISQSGNKEGKFYQRQIYRDTEDKMIAGVCGGISHFLGIQPVWVRLGVVLFFVLSGWFYDGVAPAVLLVYIILWIVIPKAVSTSDKLKMRGKPVNFDSIKEYVNKEEISGEEGKVKKNISKASNEVGNFFDTFFRVAVKFLAVFIGIILVIAGVSLIVSYFICSFSLSLTGNNDFLPYMNLSLDSSWQLYGMIVLLGIVIIIPSLFFILIGLRLITEKKIIKVTVTAIITVLVLWLISAVALIGLSITLAVSHFGDSADRININQDRIKIKSGKNNTEIQINKQGVKIKNQYDTDSI